MQTFKSIDIKYQSADDKAKIFKQIMDAEKAYFQGSDKSRKGNQALFVKAGFIALICLIFYLFASISDQYLNFNLWYCLFGFALLLFSLNIGHDAAHHAVTGKAKIDNVLFRISFMLQGLSGFLWQIRHNNSHHVFPNVIEQDTDMDFGGIINLSPDDKRSWFHKYQHLYAPIIYMFGSMILIYLIDFEMMVKKKHGNLRIEHIPFKEWVLFFGAKILHVSIFILFPYILTDFALGQILISYMILQGTASIFMFMTFVISHHVEEVDHNAMNPLNLVDDSWIHHQIVTTIDFNHHSKIANFLFGGFNLHVAHHVFPSTSHIHYPELTNIICEVLEKNGVSGWYKSYGFFDGVLSHFRYIRNIAKEKEESIAHQRV